jgi:hypothetical protein
MGARSCIIKIDSKVIAAQIQKELVTRDAVLEKYLGLVRRMENYFKGFLVKHIRRNKKIKANKLAKAPSQKVAMPPDAVSHN